MATRQYIGARYVVKVYENSQTAGSAEWEQYVTYEPLVLVTYQNGSYLSKKEVPSTIGNPAQATDYWVQTGFYNGQIANLQHQIDTINDALDTLDGNFDELENYVDEHIAAFENILKSGKHLNGNLILNFTTPFTTGGGNNGSCYIGNNNIVVYYSVPNNNVGILRCFNTNTYTVVWEYSIKGYHGNSIAFNPNNNHLYICGCMDNVSRDYINTIVEIDLNNPSVVLREFSIPTLTEAYSLTFDKSTNEFYSIAYAGTTAGTSDMLYVINEELTSIVRSVQLEQYPSVVYKLSSQGSQLAIDGIVYIPTYSYQCKAIYGYNVADGKLKTIAMLPNFINKCRSIGEVQSLVYNDDTDTFIVCSLLAYCGIHATYCTNLFEVDLFNPIVSFEPVPSNAVFGGANSTGVRAFTVVNGGNTLKPSWIVDANLITIPQDAFWYSKLNNISVALNFTNSAHSVTAQYTKLSTLEINNFNGFVIGDGDTEIYGLSIEAPCNIIFRNCKFKGYEATQLANNYWCNVFLSNLPRVIFQNCTFESYDATGNNRYHIIAYQVAQAFVKSCTFEGTVDNNYLANIGGSVTDLT